MSKKCKIILICLVVAAVLIVGITVPLVLLNKKDGQLTTPNAVEVYQSEELIVFKTNKVENAVKYVFEISIPGNELPTKINCETNELVLDFSTNSALKNEFMVAGVYSVSCYAEAENKVDNSYKSAPTNFNRQITLASPTIYKSRDVFKWETILNATTYELFISSTGTVKTLVVPSLGDTSLGVEEISITSLKQELGLSAGTYLISIRALNSDNENYKTSKYSSAVEFTVV